MRLRLRESHPFRSARKTAQLRGKSGAPQTVFQREREGRLKPGAACADRAWTGIIPVPGLSQVETEGSPKPVFFAKQITELRP